MKTLNTPLYIEQIHLITCCLQLHLEPWRKWKDNGKNKDEGGGMRKTSTGKRAALSFLPVFADLRVCGCIENHCWDCRGFPELLLVHMQLNRRQTLLLHKQTIGFSRSPGLLLNEIHSSCKMSFVLLQVFIAGCQKACAPSINQNTSGTANTAKPDFCLLWRVGIFWCIFF